ncbi:MAG: tetratricopeptide repeat protein [Holosporaceae bacterium]|jgi:superkiller protein 3|nr:tetratricopeptide repeat protein [Holosporaceae bacterium]
MKKTNDDSFCHSLFSNLNIGKSTLLSFSVLCLVLFGCVSTNVSKRDPYGSMVRIADKARKSGNHEAAMNFYKRAMEIDPEHPSACLGLAECCLDKKLLDAANDYIKKAEDKGCNRRISTYLRGKMLLLRGSVAEAEKIFSRNGSVDAMNALGAICASRGQHKKAQDIFKKVIARDTNYIHAYRNLGLSLMCCKQYKDAIFYLENACYMKDANISNRMDLALAYGLSGNVQKAREIYAQDFDGRVLEEKVAALEDLLAEK